LTTGRVGTAGHVGSAGEDIELQSCDLFTVDVKDLLSRNEVCNWNNLSVDGTGDASLENSSESRGLGRQGPVLSEVGAGQEAGFASWYSIGVWRRDLGQEALVELVVLTLEVDKVLAKVDAAVIIDGDETVVGSVFTPLVDETTAESRHLCAVESSDFIKNARHAGGLVATVFREEHGDVGALEDGDELVVAGGCVGG